MIKTPFYGIPNLVFAPSGLFTTCGRLRGRHASHGIPRRPGSARPGVRQRDSSTTPSKAASPAIDSPKSLCASTLLNCDLRLPLQARKDGTARFPLRAGWKVSPRGNTRTGLLVSPRASTGQDPEEFQALHCCPARTLRLSRSAGVRGADQLYGQRNNNSHPMKFQTSCSLHLVFSQPADVFGSVTRLIEFLGDQGVHDQKFLDEFQVSATETINSAIEGCLPGDRFTEITLSVNSLELQLEVATSSPEGLNGKASSAGGRKAFLARTHTAGS